MRRRLLALLGLGLLLSACAGSPPDAPTDEDAAPHGLPLDGFLFYREPLILPPDAVAQVRLVRLSPEGAVADIVAVTETGGPMLPPIPFRLLYDPRYLSHGAGATALLASIDLHGRTLFRSEEPLLVVLPLPVEGDAVLVPLIGQWGLVDVAG